MLWSRPGRRAAGLARAWLAALCLCLPVLGAAQGMAVVPAGSGGQDITPYWLHVADPSTDMTVDQVRQLAVQGPGSPWTAPAPNGSAVGFGFSKAAHWLRLTLRNPTAEPSAQMLEIANARLSYVSLFVPDGTGQYQAIHTGGDTPFATRPYASRHFVFPLTVAPQSEQVLYVRVQSTTGLIVPAKLWPAADYAKHQRDDYMVQSVYFGVAAAMILFNLLLFVALRDRAYLLYVSFAVSSVLILAAKAGLWDEFLWPHHWRLTSAAFYTAVSLGFVSFFQFTRIMLSTQALMPRIDKALRLLSVLHVVAPVLYWTSFALVAPYAIGVIAFSAITAFGVGVWGMIRRMRAAYFFMGAFSMLLIGVFMVVLRSAGLLPTNVFTVDGALLGSTLEMLLLAFALADRFNQLRREKINAQQQLMETQQHLLENLQSSERILAQRVDERTEQLLALNQKLEALSMVDGLTGIANRRQFDQVLAREWTHMQRKGHNLALVMLDVDHFKSYNDVCGHQAGDECLRSVAQAIASICRTGDLVARYGGEEFVIIAPGTDAPQAVQLAQRACDTVRAMAMPHPLEHAAVVTVSCGVAVMVPSPDSTLEALLGYADAALYQAKARGRNQVVGGDFEAK